MLGPEALCHRVWGGDVGRCSAGPRELCECVLGGDGEPEVRCVACSRAARAARGDTGRGSRRVSPPGPVRRPRIEQEAVPETQESRRDQARGARAFRGDATGWSPGHASLVPSGKRRGGLACGPFRGRVPRLWRQEDLWGGYSAERGRGEGLAGLGGDIWSFGHNWRPSRRSRGEAKYKAGSRSRRPQLPGAPVFPATS